jgi:hypothetical protein
MKKFEENTPAEQETSIESRGDAGVESLESTETKIDDTSEEAITGGESLLTEAAEGIKVEEVEDGPGLLEAARLKMVEVGESIKNLATSTTDKLKRAVVGVKLEDMSDDELADDLRGKRERHIEAIAHSKMVLSDEYERWQDGDKSREGPIKRSFEVREDLKKDRAETYQEVSKRGVEVPTDAEIEAANEDLLSNIEYSRKRWHIQKDKLDHTENASLAADELDYLKKIEQEIAKLTKQAEERGLEIPDPREAEMAAFSEIDQAYRTKQAERNRQFAEEYKREQEAEQKRQDDEEWRSREKARQANQFRDGHGVVQDEGGHSTGNSFDKDFDRL